MDVIRGIAKLMVMLTLIIIIISVEAHQLGCLGIQFNFPSFNPNSIDNITFRNDSLVGPDRISLTGDSTVHNGLYSVGRIFYKDAIPIWSRHSNGMITLASFSTSFRFRIQNSTTANISGDGMAFLISAEASAVAITGGSLGILSDTLNGDRNNRIVAVEFDTYGNPVFNDPDDNHAGIDINSLNSTLAKPLTLVGIDLKLGKKLKAWVDYSRDSMNLSMYISNDGSPKPLSPFLSKQVLLNESLPSDIYVGFSAATSDAYEVHEILSWEFNSTDPVPVTSPSSTPLESTQKRVPSGIIGGIVSAVFFLLLLSFIPCFILRRKRKVELGISRREFRLDHAELAECAGPRRFTYKEIITATRNFSKDNYLGCGGFGPVHRGILVETGTPVTVKSIGPNSKQGEREFMAEVTIISRIRHRNLVRLQGWCHDKGQLFLVYDLMTNGSLDRHLFKKLPEEEGIATPDKDQDKGKREENPLDWDRRHRILCGLAAGLLYLHEEWDRQVIHRDVKSANVMLDQDFNAHLGDFGLARLVDHNMVPCTTIAAGTYGYLAPEVPETGKATSASDVYSFGAVALEVACGRPILNYDAPSSQVQLLEWDWDLYSKGRLLEAIDPHMGDDFEEDMVKVLCLGLACSHPLPDSRPTMRQVHGCLLNGTPTPSNPCIKAYGGLFNHNISTLIFH